MFDLGKCNISKDFYCYEEDGGDCINIIFGNLVTDKSNNIVGIYGRNINNDINHDLFSLELFNTVDFSCVNKVDITSMTFDSDNVEYIKNKLLFGDSLDYLSLEKADVSEDNGFCYSIPVFTSGKHLYLRDFFADKLNNLSLDDLSHLFNGWYIFLLGHKETDCIEMCISIIFVNLDSSTKKAKSIFGVDLDNFVEFGNNCVFIGDQYNCYKLLLDDSSVNIDPSKVKILQ